MTIPVPMRGRCLPLLAGLLLAGCADIESVATQRPAQVNSVVADPNPLVGSRDQELLRTYGEPDQILEIDADRRAYVYGVHRPANDRQAECTDAYVMNSAGRIIDYYCR